MKTWHLEFPLPYKYKRKNDVVEKTLNVERQLLLNSIVILAFHDSIRKKIDEDYSKDKARYNSFLNEDYMESYDYFLSHPPQYAVYMKKIMAMYLAQPEEKRYTFMRDYIKFGYKRIYDMVAAAPEPFSVGQVILQLSKMKISAGEHNNLIGLSLYIRFCEKKYSIINDAALTTTIENFVTNDTPIEEARHDQFHLDDIQTQQAFKMYESIIGKKIPRTQTMDTLLDDIESHAAVLAKKEGYDLTKDFEKIYDMGIYKPLKCLLRIAFGIGIHDLYISYNVPYPREEYLMFYAQFLNFVNRGNATIDEFDYYFSAHLILYSMQTHYKKVAESYLELVENDEDAKLDEKKKELSAQEAAFMAKKAEDTRKMEQLSEENNMLKARILELERQVKRNEQKEVTEKQLANEVLALREYVFDNENSKPEEKIEEGYENAVEMLNNKQLKVALFGGHQRFVQKFKQTFPNIRTVAPEELHVDLSFVNQMDVVLFDTSYNNHANYIRFRDAIKNESVLIHFIHGQKSIALIAKNILQRLN